MSGHCAFMSRNTEQGRAAHERCHAQGGGNRANPKKEFQPCPCRCHYESGDGMLDIYECDGCGGEIVEAPLWPFDEDGDARYTHIDRETDRATGEDCPDRPAPKRKDEQASASRDCVRCGCEFTSSAGSKVCAHCLRDEERERAEAAAAEDNLDDFDDLDDLSDFD